MPRPADLVQTNRPIASMPTNEQAIFPSRLAALGDTAEFAQDFCERNGVSRDDALRLTLIIEELFTNTVQHGYGVESDAPIRVGLSLHEGEIMLQYEDSAPPCDPLSLASELHSNLAPSIDARPVGGLGIHLVRGLVSGARYAYEGGSNRLWLTLKTSLA